MFLKYNKKNIRKGFTLVESLVAISILMVAIVTPMTIAQKGLGSANYSKDQMTASFLAQDALEFIKNKRDEIGARYDVGSTDPVPDWLIGNGTNILGIDSGCISTNGCNVDTISGTYVVDLNKELSIYRNSEGKFFYYGHKDIGSLASAPSKFIRNVKIEKTANLAEALITVTVRWQNNGIGESVVVKNFIYNYWENL